MALGVQHIAHQESRPQKSSWMFSGIFQWTFSGIFQHNLNIQWYIPKDCNFSSDFSLELPNGLSVAFSNSGISLLVISGVIFCPGLREALKGNSDSNSYSNSYSNNNNNNNNTL